MTVLTIKTYHIGKNIIIAANIDGLRLNQQLTQEEFARKAGLVRQVLEQEHISLGHAAEILRLSREEMRRTVGEVHKI